MRKINNLKILCLFIVCFMLNGCFIYYPYGSYFPIDKELTKTTVSRIGICCNTGYFSIPFFQYGNYTKTLDLYFGTERIVADITAFLIIPIGFSFREYTKIENDNDNLIITVIDSTYVCNKSSVIKDKIIKRKYTNDEIKNLKLYIKKGNNLYRGIFGKFEFDDIKIIRDGRNYPTFTFPIKIKDIGKEGATLIIEYKDIKKEIPFIYKLGWMYR